MKKRLLILLAFMLVSVPVLAAVEKTNNPKREIKGVLPSPENYKKLEKYSEFMADEKYAEAQAGFEGMLQRKLNAYERAVVLQYLGYLAMQQDKPQQAIKYFKEVVQLNSLPNRTHFNVMSNIARMYMATGQFRQAEKAWLDYFKATDEIRDSDYALLANTYVQMEQFRKGQRYIKKAIGMADKASESWYQLLLVTHQQLGEFRQAAKVLEYLVENYPHKKNYWKQLSQTYFALKQDDKALAALDLANLNGLLTTEQDFLQLFKLYAYLDIPYKAGKVLEEGLKSGAVKSTKKNWKDLGATWYQAQELNKSLEAFKKAAGLSDDGELDFQIANIYVGLEDWANAKTALQSALRKGGLKDRDVGNTWLLLGMAENYLGNTSAARKALEKAKQFPRVRDNAQQWLNHMKQTQMTKARLEEEAQEQAADDTADAASEG